MELRDDQFNLRRYESRDGLQVVQWASTPEIALAWASLDKPCNDPAIFAQWHSEPGIHAYVLALDGRLVAYGEIWEELEISDVEIARIIVAPGERGRGIGRVLIQHLLSRCPSITPRTFYVRVRPDNTVAFRCYLKAGFRFVPSEERRQFNADQPTEYVWMLRLSSP
jgi:ribosomal protein S18 acetylase RimI-like enzyme